MIAPLWFSNLLSWAAQVALLVFAAGFVVPRVVQLRQPSILLPYWRVLLLVCLALPLIQPWHHARVIGTIVPASDFTAPILPPSSMASIARWHLPSLEAIAPILGVLILAGIGVRFAMLAIGLWKLCQFRRASSPISPSAESATLLDAMRTRVNTDAEFRLSAAVDSPVTFGLAKPSILLPERFLSLNPSVQAAIACHELLHVRRNDWAHHLFEEVVRATLWFHPAIAWLVARVRLAREAVVDLEVVRLTSERKTYLEALLEFTTARPRTAAIPAPPFLAERQLVERIALMVKEVRMSRPRFIASSVVVVGCLGLAVALAAWTFPLKNSPLPADSASASRGTQGDSGGAAQTLQRIVLRHHDFAASSLNDGILSDEQARMNQLPDHPVVDSVYDAKKVEHVEKVLEDFWNQRGITVDVHASLITSPRSSHYAILQLDLYKQTILSGRLEGGISGGVSSGVAQGLSRGVSAGIGQGLSNGVATGIGQGVNGGVKRGVVEAVSSGVSSGINNGINAGVSGGVSDGMSSGVNGEMRRQASSGIPTVNYSTIWTDTVKRGPMLRQVRGLGKLVSAGDSTLVAKVTMPVYMTVDVRPNQSAAVDTRMGVVKGHVVNISPSGDNCSIDVALDSALPERATVGLTVDATIDIEKLENVLYVGRPVHGEANTTIGLFKISKGGLEAQRVNIKLGRSSVNTIEVLDGLQAGDKIILSDMSEYDNVERISLSEKQPSSR